MDIYDMSLHFTQSKYTRWYFSIIQKSITQNRKKTKNQYFEHHHILPRSLYPSYVKDKWNVAVLTAREHFICHWLLTKMVADEKSKHKMHNAMHMMSRANKTFSNNRTLTSFEYEIARKYVAKSMSENNPSKRSDVRAKISFAKKGKPASEETKRKQKESNPKYWLGKQNPKVGHKFYNNGITQRVFHPNEVPDGWVLGRLNKPWNVGKKLGKAKAPNTKKGYKMCNDGLNNKFFPPNQIPDGWVLGRLNKASRNVR